jgi:hypothetical protein
VIDRIAILLTRHRFRCITEADVQAAIARIFTEASVPFRREVALGDAGIIDFVVGDNLGIEVKTDGGLSAVTRQLHRYAQCDELASLVLATTLLRHRRMPATLGDKPLAVVHLAGGFP